ncbi:MAG: DUF1232 domain-containing protein [Desulfobulbaceae bacterium]|uniref:DUF1232 domain-containing protein n=1 Tax=Candidatus Desulfatifera sulfidica TaxID=2841691 RepID=A0A8J6NBU3_9BACT|nr:DUF1232 domain-containing protein [Candidatus Desulfatifera sulfidica]
MPGFRNMWLRPGLWPRIQYYGRLLLSSGTPWRVKLILLAALIYLMSPYDLLPDWILGLGLVDDITLVTLLVGLAIRLAERANRRRSSHPNDFERSV